MHSAYIVSPCRLIPDMMPSPYHFEPPAIQNPEESGSAAGEYADFHDLPDDLDHDLNDACSNATEEVRICYL